MSVIAHFPEEKNGGIKETVYW